MTQATTCKVASCDRKPSRHHTIGFCSLHGATRKPDNTGLLGGHYGCSIDCTINHAKERNGR